MMSTKKSVWTKVPQAGQALRALTNYVSRNANLKKSKTWDIANLNFPIPSPHPKNLKNIVKSKALLIQFLEEAQNQPKYAKIYHRNLVTCKGDQEIWLVSRRG